MCWTNLNTFWSAREMSEPHSKCTKMHFFGIRVWFIVAPIAPFRAPKVVKRLRKKCHLVPKRYWFPAVFQKGFLNQTIKNAGQNRAECIKFWPILSSFLTNFEPVTGRQSTQDRADRFSAVEQPTHRQYLLDIADGSAVWNGWPMDFHGFFHFGAKPMEIHGFRSEMEKPIGNIY